MPCISSVHVLIDAGLGRPIAASSLAMGWSPSVSSTPSPKPIDEPEPPWLNGVVWATPSL